jgi:predicted nucleic acid-binding protein
MSWLLDTNVLSQAAKPNGNSRVVAWLESEFDRCYTSSVVIGEIAYWVRTKEGAQRLKLQRWLTNLLNNMDGRVHGFSVSTAHIWAEQQYALNQSGIQMPLVDSLIAATAKRHGLTIVTGNDRDFRHPGIKIFNPFKA